MDPSLNTALIGMTNSIPEIKPHLLCHEEPQTDGAELDDLQRTRSGMSVKTQDYSHRSRLEPALQCTRLMIRILDRATWKSTSMREFLPLPSSYSASINTVPASSYSGM